MRKSDVVHYSQQVAALGLSPHAAIAEMLTALKPVVDAKHMAFFWADAFARPRDMWIDHFIPHALEPMLALSDGSAPADEPTIDKILRSGQQGGNCASFPHISGWDRSVMKNEVYRGYGINDADDIVIRDGKRVIGAIGILLEKGVPALSSENLVMMLALRPHFAHALSGSFSHEAPSGRSAPEATACVIAGNDGTILSVGAGADEALFRLRESDTGFGANLSDIFLRLPPAAMTVLARLQAICSGKLSKPPTTDVITRYGVMRVTAHPMQTGGVQLHGGFDEVVITIQSLIDWRVRILRHLCSTELTPAERRVAMRMAGPGDGNEIARDLGLTTASYRQYAKRIYAGLGVEGRAGLQHLLD